MDLPWDAVRGAGRGAYAEWEAATIGPTRWWTHFLECSATSPGPETIDELLRSGGLLLPREEVRWLRRARALLRSGREVGPLWTTAAIREGEEDALPRSWVSRHVGPPTRGAPFGTALSPEKWQRSWPLANEDAEAPILGVIDDGFGYLHDRFRSEGGTRIAALWRQGTPGAPVLRKAEIDARIQADRTEHEVYARDAAERMPGLAPRLDLRRFSHGTMVADLAGGTAPGEPDAATMMRVPLLAVELPTPAVADSSGRRLEPYVARGLRWIVTEALRMGGRGRRHSLVVNLSLGSLTGPAEASFFLVDLIRAEAERYRRHAGAPMRVVAAYGNERTARLAARSRIGPTKAFSVLWRLPPDDRTASFLELRAQGAACEDLTVALTRPGEVGPSLEVPWPASGEGHAALSHALLMGDGGGDPALLLAVAPTAGPNPNSLGRPGSWRIEVRSKVPGVLVTARVQRDETLQGHWLAGRQSWLDGGRERGWSDETRGWTAPGPDDPVTPRGTGVTCAVAGGPTLLLAGAARRRPDGTVVAAGYSGQGSKDGGSPGPDLVAICEDGMFAAGRRAAGRFSGTKVRARGTSVAAALVTRRLLEAYLQHKADMNAAQEEQALFGGKRPRRVRSRMGRGVLAES